MQIGKNTASGLRAHRGFCKLSARRRSRLSAVASLIAAALSTTATRATDYSWRAATNGTWITPNVWLPSGTPNSSSDTATIASTGSNYTVTLNSNITVSSLTLNSANATLDHTAGTFTFTTANINAGTYTLDGGTIAGGQISVAGGVFKVQAGTLSNASITGSDVNVNGSLHIAGTLSIADHNLNLAGSSNLYFSGQSIDNLNITPASAITIFPEASGVATVTFGSGVIIHGGAIINNNNGGDGVTNNGTITSDLANNSTFINTTNFANNGYVAASTGSINVTSSSWTNSGTILSTGGSANLGGNFSLNGAGTFNAAGGGSINITGTLNNVGSTITLNSSTGSLGLSGGTISGGTVNQSGGLLRLQAGTLSNVAITGSDLNLANVVHIAGTFSIADHNLNMASGSNLYFSGQSVDNLNITPAGSVTIYPEGSSAATVTFGSGVIIHGGAIINNNNGGDGVTNNGTITSDLANNSTFINTTNFANNGYVAASTGSINVTSSSWTNSGTILSTGGSANLGGNFSLNGAGTFNAAGGGSINITGTLNNVGSTITLNSSTGSLGLSGGTISGGTVNQSGGLLRLQAGTLSNVAITGSDLNLANVVHIAGTFSIADHNLNMASGSNLYFSGQSVDNLNITPAGSVTIYPEGSSAATVTFGSGVVVHGGAIFNNNNAGDGVTNNGTITSDLANNSTFINTTNFANNGYVAASTGSINVTSSSWTNSGTILTTGGTANLGGSFTLSGAGTFNASAGGSINITGTLTNTGNTITLNSATGSLGLNGGTISGGTISQSGGLLRLQAGTLSNVAVTGSDLNFANVVHIAGTFSIADHNLNMASGSNLYFSGQSVDNLNITPAGSVTIYPEGSSAATVTFGSGVIIHGGAIINTTMPATALLTTAPSPAIWRII